MTDYTKKYISVSELAWALLNKGVAVKATDLWQLIEAHRQAKAERESQASWATAGKPVPDYPDMTVTSKELDDAYARNGWGSTQAVLDLLNDIKLHREPVWKVGDVVTDSSGQFWRRDGAGTWVRFQDKNIYSESGPLRPLKLVGRNNW